MKHLPFVLVGGAAVALVACNLFIKVPPEYAGDTKITIHNKLDHDICFLSMTAKGAPPSSTNWLKHDIPSDAGRVFKIKPGDYHLELGCGQQFHGAADVRIAGDTTMNVGIPADANAFAGVFIPATGNVGRIVYQQAVGGAPPGTAAAPPAAEEAAPEPKRDCWPDGHPCEFGTDPCCNSCGHNPNTGRQECY